MPLPAILPILIYHGQEKLNLQGQFTELMNFDPVFQRYIPDFAYHLVDLSVYPDDETKGTVLLRVVLLLLKNIHRPDIHERLFHILKELRNKKTGMEYIETLLRYIMATVPDMTGEELRRIVEQSVSQDMEGTIMTLEEKLKQEGKQEGRQEGRQEGLRQGLLKAIQLGLKLKFGAAASGLMDAIQKIPDVTRLDEILEAIESASQVSDIRKMVLQ